MGMKLEGVEELQAAFAGLEDKLATKYGKHALRAGAEVLLPAIRSSAPLGKTGDLRDGLEIAVEGPNIVVRTGQGNRGIQQTLKRIRKNASKMAGKAAGKRARKEAEAELKARGIKWQGQYYGSILSHGFKHGKTYVPADDWMGAPMQSNATAAIEAIRADLAESIEQGFKE